MGMNVTFIANGDVVQGSLFALALQLTYVIESAHMEQSMADLDRAVIYGQMSLMTCEAGSERGRQTRKVEKRGRNMVERQEKSRR